MAKQLKKLLVISWALPPYLSPRSIQVARTLAELSKRGWAIDVLTQSRSHLFEGGNFDAALEARYGGKYRAISLPGLPVICASILYRLIPSIDPIPDHYVGWARRAVRSGKELIAVNRYEAMISFAQTWSSHLVGLALKRTSHLPWIAHFSDPWADNPYTQKDPQERQALVRDLEAQVIENADAVIFTNTQTSQLVMKKYPQAWAQKAFVMPHGFETKQIANSEKRSGLTFVYTGSLYGLRSPEAFIRAVKMLKDKGQLDKQFRAIFAGHSKRNKKYRELTRELGLEEQVQFIGKVSQQESLTIAEKADVLLVIDAPSEESLFLPSKLVDYLQHKKSILGITPIRGASADLLGEIGASVADPTNIASIADEISKLQERWRHGKLGVSTGFSKAAKAYEIATTTDILEKILTEVVGKVPVEN